jgi:hypothetical protein
MLGIPGCIGSTDGVHVGWANCPYQWRHIFTGKEKAPTLAFNVTCNHHRWIHGSTIGHPGGRNDLTTSRTDELLEAVREDPFFKNRKFKLIGRDGIAFEVDGVWVLCDGGYHKWRVMQCPLKVQNLFHKDEIEWARRLESIRKDVECLFGIIKARFRILKLPLLCSGKNGHEKAQNIFFACCMLHNMLLEDDKLMDWEEQVDWDGVDGLFDQDTPYVSDPGMDFNSHDGAHQNRVPWGLDTGGQEDFSEKAKWHELRQQLITHFANPVAKEHMKWNTLPKGRMKK